MDDRLRIGVIGAGAHGSENLLPALRLSPDFTIGAICTRSESTATAAAARWGAEQATTSIDVACKSADALLVSGPPQLHEDVLRAAVAHGLPLFVEKPPARTLAHLDAALEGAPPDSPVFVDYNMRFSTAWELARQTVSPSEVRLLTITMLARKPRALLWGAPTILASYLLAVGIHAVDLAVATLGLPTSVSTVVTELGDTRVAAHVTLGFDGGRTALLELGNQANSFETRFEAVGHSGARVRVDNLTHVTAATPEPLALSDKASASVDLSGLVGGFDRSGYAGALASFARTVRDGEPSESGIGHNRTVMAVLDQIAADASTEGRP